jgi:hypothetical protein
MPNFRSIRVTYEEMVTYTVTVIVHDAHPLAEAADTGVVGGLLLSHAEEADFLARVEAAGGPREVAVNERTILDAEEADLPADAPGQLTCPSCGDGLLEPQYTTDEAEDAGQHDALLCVDCGWDALV